MAEAEELGDLEKAQKTTRAGVTMARGRDWGEDCRDEASLSPHGGNKSQDEASPRTQGGNKSQTHRETAREIKTIRGGGRRDTRWEKSVVTGCKEPMIDTNKEEKKEPEPLFELISKYEKKEEEKGKKDVPEKKEPEALFELISKPDKKEAEKEKKDVPEKKEPEPLFELLSNPEKKEEEKEKEEVPEKKEPEPRYELLAEPEKKEEKKKPNQKETRKEQLAHIEEKEGQRGLEKTEVQTEEEDSKGIMQEADTKKVLEFEEIHGTVLNQSRRQSTTHQADGPAGVLENQHKHDLAKKPDHHGVLELQPTDETFLLVHGAVRCSEEKKKHNQRETRKEQLSHIEEKEGQLDSEKTEVQKEEEDRKEITLEPDTKKCLEFTETHRTDHNQTLRHSTTHLADGPGSVQVDHTRALDFVIVSGDNLNPNYNHFKSRPGDRVTYTINDFSHINDNHICYLKFVGRRIAKPIYDNKLHECNFTRGLDCLLENKEDNQTLRQSTTHLTDGPSFVQVDRTRALGFVIASGDSLGPNCGSFNSRPVDKGTYTINNFSHINYNYICYLQFVGRRIAKAIYDNKLHECDFTRGIDCLLENKVTDQGYDLTFSDYKDFG